MSDTREDKNPHRDSYAVVGELVLISNALDQLLAEVLIEVLSLVRSPLLMPVIITLDPARKIEILKQRTKHISQGEWKRGLKDFVENAEKVFKYRNIACHTQPILVGDQWTLKPFAAAKMFRVIDVANKRIKSVSMDELKSAISVAEKTLGSGVNLVENFQRLNAEMAKRLAQKGHAP